MEALNLTLTHLKSTSSPSSPSPSFSPSSSFRIRIQKTSSGSLLSSSSLSSLGSGAGFGPGSVLKRKRPGRLDIPVATAMAFVAPLMESQGCREMESEGDGYSVYCNQLSHAGRANPALLGFDAGFMFVHFSFYFHF
ncbi:hypothetical protein SLEP1_g57073 [Rubroshorea leprosula]|uniref:Uncharacterized protein n=1 Tax=Rubroshorea leprosula TaxID=152421 RepID=A0AAV5MNP1_9ROSI|nr:hypothetical protein SLEP1_g57073 [Rubroshorea leprosula]